MYSKGSRPALSRRDLGRDTFGFLDNRDDVYYYGSDTTADESTCSSTVSSSSTTGLLANSYAEDILSVSLSISNISPSGSSVSLCPIPPFPRTSVRLGYSTFVNMKSSPFLCCKGRPLGALSDDLSLKTVISIPTSPRLKSMLTEKLYIAGWADNLRPSYIPNHVPWNYAQDEFEPMPWIPEGSVVSKDRFYQVRCQDRSKSYSPPPELLCEDVDLSPPVDPLPFPSFTPEPQKNHFCLKRSASFHPGGSWRIRRGGLVIDGNVSEDNSKDKKHWSAQLPSSSSEPTKLDIVLRWQEMNALQEKGLEGLKNSVMKMMKEQEFLSSVEPLSEIPLSDSFASCSLSSEAGHEDPRIAQLTTPAPLDIRRGGGISSLTTVKTDKRLALVSPPDSRSPDKDNKSNARSTMDATDMCANLRSILYPLASPCLATPPDCQKSISMDSSSEHSLSLDCSTFIVEDVDISRMKLTDEWEFAKDYITYGEDPFGYSNRVSCAISPHQHSSPISVAPKVLVSTHAETPSISAAPSYPTLLPVIPEVVVSEELVELPESITPRPKSRETPSILPDMPEVSQLHCTTKHSADEGQSLESPNSSSEDEDASISTRRWTTSSTPLSKEPSITLSHMKRIPDILKPVKTVRFAPSTTEHVYPAEGPIAHPPSRNRSPKHSSLRHPSPLRNEYVIEKAETAVRSQGIEVDAGLLHPTKAPRKNRFSMIPLAGRLSPLVFATGAKPDRDKEGQPSPPSKKNPFSMIPVAGRSPLQVKKLNSNIPVELSVRPSTPSPSRGPKKTTPKSQESWTLSLRRYNNGGDNENESLRSPTPNPGAKQGKAKALEIRSLKKPSPSKRAAYPTDTHKSGRVATPLPVSSVDDAGKGPVRTGAGISFIAPPRAVAPSVRRIIGKENVSFRDSFDKHKIPAHLRTLLGRLTG